MNKILSLLMGVGLAGFLLALQGCACWSEASRQNDIGCVVVHAVVDCSVDAGKAFGPDFIPVIVNLIKGNPGATDWTAIKKAAEGMGLKDGGCFLAELKNALFGQPGAGPEMLAAVHALSNTLDAYKKAHLSADVKFKVVDKKTGKSVLL